MKLSLVKEQGPCPPDGFRYVDPVDGFVAHAWTYNDWVDIERQHLQANARPVPQELGIEMQQQLCLTLPPGWCSYDDPSRPRPAVSLDWGTVATALQTFAGWIKGGCKVVSQSEADRRAQICSNCYYNVNISGCSACQKAIAETLGVRKSKFDYALKGCAICKCVLRAKIHFGLNDLAKDIETHQDMYSQVNHCWLNKESENYHGIE